jgi:hypothetical protein
MLRKALAVGFMVAAAAFAGTDVAQTNITTNTTWTLNGSPYYIYGDLYITNGATLTINGGVEVRFVEIHGDGGYEDGAELVVRSGALVTRGSTSLPVLFTSANQLKRRGDWGAVVVEGNNQYILTGTTIEYAKNGLRLASTTALSASRSSTEGTIIHWCSNSAVYAYYASADFYHLSVLENDYAGIKTSGSCNVSVGNSDVYSNGMYNYYNGGPSNVDATNCWWGSATPSLIELRIYDKNDSPSSGTVDYTPFLSGPWRDRGNVNVYSLGFVKSIFQ